MNNIIKLRNKGKSYSEIQKILGCSKGTISYHCGEGQKEKSKSRLRKRRKTLKGLIEHKIYNFGRKIIIGRIRSFKRGGTSKKKTTGKFKYNSAYNNIINNPICYLTGRKIDLSNSKSYELDHIIPPRKGGKNTLKNMGLSCRDANQGKNDLTVREFIKLCKEVCEWNGYKVSKK